MAMTTKYGLPSPESTDVPDVPYWQKRLADGVEEALTERFQTGTATVFFSAASTSSTATVTFAAPFATVPDVVATVETGLGRFASVTSRSLTGFTVQAAMPLASNTRTDTVTIHWIATDL